MILIAFPALLAAAAVDSGPATTPPPPVAGTAAPSAPANPAPPRTACNRATPDGPPVQVEATQSQREKPGRSRSARAAASRTQQAASSDPTPTLQPETLDCTQQAASRYQQIAAQGGWPKIRRLVGRSTRGSIVESLRKRLAIEGDLASDAAAGRNWDQTLGRAVESFQRRNGLVATGVVNKATLDALNVPADVRARQLSDSAQRLRGMTFKLTTRFVEVNIPAASVEAVENGRVVQRHEGISGDPDHPSPQIVADIRSITFDPTWTLPRSIIENEVIPKLKRDPNYLRRANIDVLNRHGRRVPLRRLSLEDTAGLIFRQQPGSKNSLGRLRIDMPNKEQVYLHDTPAKSRFSDAYRFLSHGCVRVYRIDALAAWLLTNDSQQGRSWTREQVDHEMKANKKPKRVNLTSAVPVAWVYLDGWGDASGVVHFRPDVYNLDQQPNASAGNDEDASRAKQDAGAHPRAGGGD